jgi:hypothetical protein
MRANRFITSSIKTPACEPKSVIRLDSYGPNSRFAQKACLQPYGFMTAGYVQNSIATSETELLDGRTR